jgi:alkylation response protein AidB-like acyl-CoA dehydrogenase
MDFAFNEEQRSLGETVAKVLADFPALTGPDLERSQDEAAWAALAELGLFSLLVSEDDGGVGLTLIDVALAVEALGRGLAPTLVASTLIGTELLNRFGTATQKAKLLPRIAAGELRIAIAAAEAGAGDAPDAIGCTVSDDRLSGTKIAVAGASAADLLVVLARGEGGPVLILVDPAATGVTIREHETIDPSADLCEVRLAEVVVEGALRLGQGAVDDTVRTLIDLTATFHAGMAMGIAERMQDLAVDYAKTRHQFGQAIGAFQSIKHRCADMAVAVEAGRATAYYAFWSSTGDEPDRSRSASAAKAYCTEIARDVCNDAIQIHGGMGFTWELGLHRYLRRAKVIEHAVGGRAWHYGRVASEALAMRGAAGEAERRVA